MKILHVIPSIGPAKGGPSHALLNTCRALAKAGINVTLVSSDDNGPTRLDVPLGVPIEQDGYTAIYFRRTAREYTFCWGMTPWLIRHVHEFDLVHIHAVFSYTSVIAGIMAVLRRTPYAVRPAGILLSWGVRARRTFAKRLHYQIFEKWILNRAAFVQAMSQVEAEGLLQIGVTAPIEVIYHGLESPGPIRPTANTSSLSSKTMSFLFLGRFHFKKGLDILLPAFAQAVKQELGLRLLLAGDGEEDYKAWMRNRIAELDLEDHVQWLGFLQGDQKWSAIASSASVVMPSYSENFGMVVIESMMCGTPIIVSEEVALANEVATAKAGFVIPCDIDALISAMLRLARDENLRQRMGENARLLAVDKFGLEQATNCLISAYQHYCGENQK